MCYSWEQLEIFLCCFPDEALNMQIIFSRCMSVSRRTEVCIVLSQKNIRLFQVHNGASYRTIVFSFCLHPSLLKPVGNTGSKIGKPDRIAVHTPRTCLNKLVDTETEYVLA